MSYIKMNMASGGWEVGGNRRDFMKKGQCRCGTFSAFMGPLGNTFLEGVPDLCLGNIPHSRSRCG